MLIKKSDGSIEPFDTNKLLSSLARAGANSEDATNIIEKVSKVVQDHRNHVYMARDLYHEAFYLLKKKSKVAAAKYSLRRSIMEFGPTGFPFEKYIAEILKSKGYHAITDQVVMGVCVPHEIDIVAWKEGKLIMIEAKYHSDNDAKTDLKVTLYVKARYDDLKKNLYEFGNTQMPYGEGWLVTNTKFSETAITYGECMGIKLISWNYPMKGNLQDMIDETSLYPITCLTTLSSGEKNHLLSRGVVLCRNIYDNVSILEEIGVSPEKVPEIIQEVSEIIKSSINTLTN